MNTPVSFRGTAIVFAPAPDLRIVAAQTEGAVAEAEAPRPAREAVDLGELGPATYADPSPSEEAAAAGVALALRAAVLRRALADTVAGLVHVAGASGAVKLTRAVKTDADLGADVEALADLIAGEIDSLLAAIPTRESPELRASRRLSAGLDDLGAPAACDFIAARRMGTTPIDPLTPIPEAVSHHKGKYPARPRAAVG